jgi:GTP pyrophosphokinase
MSTAAILALAQEDGGGAAIETRARAFAAPLLQAELLDTGENALAHADGVAAVLHGIGAAPPLCAAAYLVYAADYLHKPEDKLARDFGPSYASLALLTGKLVQLQRAARAADLQSNQRALQTERVRKMLLAFSRDLRVVLLRLASRLQTLRWHAQAKRACPRGLAEESRDVFAALANRLGIWQIKWELEDLAFRFIEPDHYKQVAGLLAQTRASREDDMQRVRQQVQALLAEAGVAADVQARPKHLYSIWKKMRGKRLDFSAVHDVRAVRIIVADKAACYAALARVQQAWVPLEGQYSDYIAKPKPNGYQSLHTVLRGPDGRSLEVQIRTRDMHEHAEHGVAAHWMYKEAGVRGYAGVAATGEFEEQVAHARQAVLRQLLAWERDFAGQPEANSDAAFDDRIYVLTPEAAVIELATGATPVDFAYAVHTQLGHRCRGARVDGVMVPLNTPLQHGQTVEIVAAREGGPSLDWLNAELGYLNSPRARAKVRAWFNAQALASTVARGREAVEKLLQREGRTAIKLEGLAESLGFAAAERLFEAVGKDEYSLRNIENFLRPAVEAPDEGITLRRPQAQGSGGRGGVLVVGVESLMTTLARCCRPAPPDAIEGFVTRGKGVAVHRRDCSNFGHMAAQHPQRVLEVAWASTAPAQPNQAGARPAVYPLDVQIEASDRPALLRDVSDVFAKEKMNVIGVNTSTQRSAAGALARMTFTVEVDSAQRLEGVLLQLTRVPGVRLARRR